MKKIFVSLMLIAGCFIAQPSMAQNSFSISAGKIKSLHLDDNMKVVLQKANDANGEIAADETAQRKVRFSISKGTLHVQSTDNWREGDLLIVRVAEIDVLTIGENTLVESDAIMTVPQMEVHVSAGGVARIKTFGKVEGYSNDGSEIQVQRFPLAKTISTGF